MSSPYIGEIRMFGGNFAPQGWAFCNGALQAIDENTALFQLVGTTYGGDGQNTFALPNLQSRGPTAFDSLGGSPAHGPTASDFLCGAPTLGPTASEACNTFANLSALDNSTNGDTDFTAAATGTPSAGVCLVNVSDGLTGAGHFSGGPQFVVTYTTSGINASAKRRQR